jgi:hypothetical protein
MSRRWGTHGRTPPSAPVRGLRLDREFLEGAYGAHDLDGLVEYVLRWLPELVRSELTAYNEINPRRRRIVWRDEPSLASSFPEGRRIFERHMHEHPLIAHYQASSDASARKISAGDCSWYPRS